MAFLDKFKKKIKKQKNREIEERKTEEPSKKVVKKEPAQIYRIIKEPHITEKATALAEQGKYIFKVYPQANKNEVKRAIESLYEVKVEKVNLVHIAPKKRRLGRTEGWRDGLKRGYKKAIVTLAEGEKIELMPR